MRPLGPGMPNNLKSHILGQAQRSHKHKEISVLLYNIALGVPVCLLQASSGY